MKILSDRRARIAFAAGALFIVLLLFILSAFRRNEIRTHENAEIAQGIAYLEALETTGVRGVQEAIRANETEQIREKLDDLLAKIESGEADIWSYFSDAVILGDSRADERAVVPVRAAQGDAGQIQRGEDVGEAHLVLERDADEIELLHRRP